jgi:hypothetical protein
MGLNIVPLHFQGTDTHGHKHKSPREEGFCEDKEPGGDLLSHAKSILSSARSRFTVLFGMGRGGSNSLWPPGITGIRSGLASELKTEEVKYWVYRLLALATLT